jgi:hypothetical protein
MYSFRHISKLLLGVGSAEDEDFEVTPIKILITALLVALGFLGTVSVLILVASLLI